MNWDRRAEQRVRTDVTVRRVRQITSMDCGVAAVAMIAGVPYSVAHAAVGRKLRQRRGTTTVECWDALMRLGVTAERAELRFRSWSAIGTDALVMIQWRGTKDYHWVVYQHRPDGRYRILDPSPREGTLSFVDEHLARGVSFSRVEIVRLGLPAPRLPPRAAPVAPAIPPSPRPDKDSTIAAASVMQARASVAMRQTIQQLTGLSLRSVGARLRHLHGRTLVRNAFDDVWPK